MTRFDPKAMATAVALSFALDVVGGALLLRFFGVRATEGMTPEQLTAAIDATLADTTFQLASLAFGGFTTCVGGYWAGRLAKSYPYFNALGVGLISIALSLLLSSSMPWWFDAVAYLITLPAAVAGGHLWQLQNKRT